MSTALVCSIPVWIGLVIAVWRGWSLPALIAVLVVTFTIPLTVLSIRFRWTNCPSCGQKIRVLLNSKEYRRGGMLKYRCDHCRIVWLTHIFRGGSDFKRPTTAIPACLQTVKS